MEELLKLLKENPNGVIATVDNGKPRVRPFGFIMEEEGKLYFCTNSLKEVYKQLMEVPYIEYSVTTKNMVAIRISGEISFCDDLIIKDKVLNVHEPVKLGYKSADNPIFKVFYMEHGIATISDFSGKPPEKIEF
ncbi:pyridoxamine 5'-phosphate oxidase family protein [Clostridium folliculivorans]|uniref:pyridoxamine 5'-phosphate oxidase family protein n=1 Tax=Clostridium folliculivorans TaxID=2886038 RepID=UPI0021C4AE6A|nr:pyridoxamine 5'-phosphate oxidase family protein [Clostridium folliculivorans]GKU32328.1 pyridoxamine 5'-phosphate oxidase [Clostridium folliculivorans]